MRHLAARPVVEASAPLRDAAQITDVGGPVAAIQRSIMERLAEGGSFEIAVARAPENAIDRALTLLSRCAGPVALGAGYFAAARLLLG